MRRIDVKLSLPVVAPLLDLLRSIAEKLETGLAAPMRVENLDAEMAELWEEELMEAQRTEIGTLMGLFNDEFFMTGMVRIDQAHADPVVRATSSLRLELRRSHLEPISDEALESGQVNPDEMDAALRQAFLCYVFLATLQELVIKHLEEGLA